MPRFYSPEWVAAFNGAVVALDAGAVDTGASLVAERGTFRVAQVVHDAPQAGTGAGGDLRVVLVVDGGRVEMLLDAPEAGEDPPADVTVSLSYADAAALSQGALDPAEALGRGRIRVRGDLAVLVAGQAVLVAAGGKLAGLQAATTY